MILPTPLVCDHVMASVWREETQTGEEWPVVGGELAGEGVSRLRS